MNATAQIKTATKQLVDSLLEMNTNNRPIKKTVVDCYKQDIADGRWYLTNQGIGIDINGALIDGQHRLLAIKESGYPPVSLLIVAGLLPEAQSAVDQHAKRSVRDIWRLMFETSVVSVAPAICSVIYKAQSEWGRNGRISPLRLKDILDNYMEQIEFVFSIVKNHKTFAAPYLAAFAMVAKERPEKWSQIALFIERVLSGENLTKKMPEFHLRTLLMTSRAMSGGSSVQQERFLKAKRAVLASLDGEEIGVLRATA